MILKETGDNLTLVLNRLIMLIIIVIIYKKILIIIDENWFLLVFK